MFEELVKEITKELEAKESRGRSRSGDAQNNFEYAVCYILRRTLESFFVVSPKRMHNQSAQWILF